MFRVRGVAEIEDLCVCIIQLTVIIVSHGSTGEAHLGFRRTSTEPSVDEAAGSSRITYRKSARGCKDLGRDGRSREQDLRLLRPRNVQSSSKTVGFPGPIFLFFVGNSMADVNHLGGVGPEGHRRPVTTALARGGVALERLARLRDTHQAQFRRLADGLRRWWRVRQWR